MKTLEKGLKKLRVLTKFKREFKRDHKGAYYNVALALTNLLGDDRNRLAGAFTWLDTMDGHNYWSAIDAQLEKYFKDVQV